MSPRWLSPSRLSPIVVQMTVDRMVADPARHLQSHTVALLRTVLHNT